MRFRSAVLLAALSLAAVAQRGAMSGGHMSGGGFPSGGSPLRCPLPGRPISPGRGPFGRWHNPVTLWGAPVPWLGGFLCPSGLPADPFTGACYPAYYPTYPSAPFDNSMSGMAMGDQPAPLPPPPLLPMPPMGNEPAAAQEPAEPPRANFGIEHRVKGREESDGAGSHADQAAPPARPVPEDYPALIVLKPGAMYSATKYWFKNKNLYFVTTQGETLYTPIAMIDRLYPAVRQGRSVGE
jgi:hypothetical protein